MQESPHAFGSSYAESLAQPDEFWINRLRSATAGRNLLLFAEDDGQLIGLIGSYVETTDPEVANIVSVFVAPEYRGRGLSSRLLDAILAEVRQWPGIRVARLTVNVSQTAAISAYLRAGFVHRRDRAESDGRRIEYDD